MKRHIIIDLVCDTDDNEAKHALLDDIRQELNCCWHSDISYTMREVENEPKTERSRR